MKAKVFLPLLLLILGNVVTAATPIPTVAKTQQAPIKPTVAAPAKTSQPTTAPILYSTTGGTVPNATTQSAQDAIAKNPKVNPFVAFEDVDKGGKRPVIQPMSRLNKLTQEAIAAKQITPKTGNAQVPPQFSSSVNTARLR